MGKETFIFEEVFFNKCKLCIILNWNYFNLKKHLKFKVTKKCKPCEVYRRMCDVYGEGCFSKKKNLYKWAKHGFASMSLSWKDSLLSGNTPTLL